MTIGCYIILIEAWHASAGISPSEMVLILRRKTIIAIETPLTPYILQVLIVI